MARAKKPKDENKSFNTANTDQYMQDMPVSEVLTENYMPYAMSVIVARAIPEIDGFKPAHRKLLYTMYGLKIFNKRIKCANIVGQTMQYNPHGDSSIYETLIRLSTGNEALITPFVNSKGNMGKYYSRDMAYAAYRYTEAGLTDIAKELFEGLSKNAVDMVDNYDGTLKEPSLLPTTFPNILAISTKGIAVGLASDICSFNLEELCNATIEHIKHPKADLLDIMPAPDFSTGGEILYNKAEMESIYRTGKGSIKIRSRYRVDKKARRIEIYEIPYSTTSEAIVEAIIALCQSNKIKDIETNGVRDDTDKKGLLITIEYKRSVDPDELMKKLFRLTPLQSNYSCNFTVLIDNNPVVLGVYGILDEWIKFRKSCIIRELQFDLKKDKDKLHLLQGLQKILLNINKAIKIIRETEKEKEVVPNLMQAFKIDEIQADYIAEIKLRNINREYILNRTKDITSLEEEIAYLEKAINSDAEIKKIIIKKLQQIAKNDKYINPRKTGIIYDYQEADVSIEEAIVENYPVKIVTTEHGYIKKIAVKDFKENEDIKTKDDDNIKQIIDTQNIGEILVFTDKCNVYKYKIDDMNNCKLSDFGEYANNLVGMSDDEKVLFITATHDFKGMIFILFDNGKAAKIPINVYETKFNRKKLINSFSDKAKVFKIYHIEEDRDFTIKASNKKGFTFNSSLVTLKTTKSTQGMQLIRLNKDATIDSIHLLQPTEKKKNEVDKIPSSGLMMK